MCHVSYVTCHVSCVTCHVSRVTCHVSHVTCHVSRVTCFFFCFFWIKWSSLSVEGLLSTGPTPSSFISYIVIGSFNGLLTSFNIAKGSHIFQIYMFLENIWNWRLPWERYWYSTLGVDHPDEFMLIFSRLDCQLISLITGNRNL